ncbi:MAG: zinc ribbon domain-containing protein [Akkermansia sp.]
MPIYEYITLHPDDPAQSCAVCRRGFEVRRPIDRAPLEACLLCKHPVRKVISKVNVPEITKPLSVSDAKAAGFTVLQRRDKGTYEKL